MTAKVLKSFRDKNSGNICFAGAEIEVTAARLKEINSTSAGALAEEIKADAAKADTAKKG